MRPTVVSFSLERARMDYLLGTWYDRNLSGTPMSPMDSDDDR